jgi:hypothetical protein
MSKAFIKLVLGVFSANVIALVGGLFYLGSWTSKITDHTESTEPHLTPTELKQHFMPVEETAAEFRAVNNKLDLLIQMQRNE